MPIDLRCFATLAPLMPANAGALPIVPGETVLDLTKRLGIPLEEIKLVFVNGAARVVDFVAGVVRRMQTGYLYHYAFAMILGLIVLLAVLIRNWT